MDRARSLNWIDRDSRRLLSVVTYLENWTPPSGPAPTPPQGVRFERWPSPDVDEYLRVFHRIGNPWLWYARLIGGREAVARRNRAPGYEIWRLRLTEPDEGAREDQPQDPIQDANPDATVGLCELDRSSPGEVRIVYCGLVPEYIGGGLGGFLLRSALHEAWTEDVQRVYLRTCTEDHPHALAVYQHLGFQICTEEAEWIPDPRLCGLLPRDAAPHVPLAE